MSTIARIQHKGQVTIPTRVREQAGLIRGDLVEFSFQRGKIVITPKLIIDRSQFPTADDEYTPEQRRTVDSQLAEGLSDIRKGRVSPKFDTVDEMLTSLQAGHEGRPPQKTKTRGK